MPGGQEFIVVHGRQMRLAAPRVEVSGPFSCVSDMSRQKSTWNLYAARAHIAAHDQHHRDGRRRPHRPSRPTSEPLPALMLGAIGVVYGDIGTSPLYAMKESFIGPHPLAVDPAAHLRRAVSLIFWSLMLVVTVKYVLVAMRADNKGEGGSFALLALISRNLEGGKWTAGLVMLGVLATALFYGDAMITPGDFGAVGGRGADRRRSAAWRRWSCPIAIGILVGLFLVQARGTAKVGAMFGPVVLVYFAALAVLGVSNIVRASRDPRGAEPALGGRLLRLSIRSSAFLAMGSVFLAVTGAETLYADMGHFGRKAIGCSWLTLVYPCLMLNYLGQGALLLGTPAAVENPFYLMAPGMGAAAAGRASPPRRRSSPARR